MCPIDCNFTDNIVCPYCGCEHESDGYDGPSGDYVCHDCERRFYYEADYSVTYCTWTEENRLRGEIRQWQNIAEFHEGKGRPDSAKVYWGYISNAEKRLAELKCGE